MHEIFKTHPDLEKVFVTSDNEPFYQENDAKNHGKTLKDTKVETIFNPKTLNVESAEVLTKDDQEMAEFLAQEKANEVKAALAEFDPEVTNYQEAVKLFKALGLKAENEKKDTIYPLLADAKAKAQEGVNTQV